MLLVLVCRFYSGLVGRSGSRHGSRLVDRSISWRCTWDGCWLSRGCICRLHGRCLGRHFRRMMTLVVLFFAWKKKFAQNVYFDESTRW